LDTCYYGLLAEKAIKELGYDNGKEYLKICLKALSDSSKLEILSTLKTSPKYAAELAVQLGLTPATVSHHMNMLLSARLVYVEKSDGKYYYHLNKDSIHEILEQLNSMLTV
jgi:DNA-binding transcriptional ArsR family regulator